MSLAILLSSCQSYHAPPSCDVVAYLLIPKHKESIQKAIASQGKSWYSLECEDSVSFAHSSLIVYTYEDSKGVQKLLYSRISNEYIEINPHVSGKEYLTEWGEYKKLHAFLEDIPVESPHEMITLFRTVFDLPPPLAILDKKGINDFVRWQKEKVHCKLNSRIRPDYQASHLDSYDHDVIYAPFYADYGYFLLIVYPSNPSSFSVTTLF